MTTKVINNIGGQPVKNQYIIRTEKGRFFQSYDSIIAFFPRDGTSTILDKNKWNYSRTTVKYLSILLNENRKAIEQKIKEGVYILADLN